MTVRTWIRASTCLLLAITGMAGAADEYRSAQPDDRWLDERDLTMLALERERMANHLAAYVANTLVRSKRRQTDRHLWARRLLGLALTLHPQNPRALLTDRALAGRQPLPVMESEHAPELLAQLLYQRAKQLRESKPLDRAMANYLIATAAFMQPYSEDVVYDHECRRLKHGALNWSPISGEASPDKPAK